MARKPKYPIVYFIIAVGGYLKEPDITKLEITEEEIKEYLEDSTMPDETEEHAVAYFIGEEIAVWNQHFCQAIALSEKEFNVINSAIQKLTP